MDAAVVKKILISQSDFVIYNGEVYKYPGRGRIYSKDIINISDFINNKSIYEKVVVSDFMEFSVLTNYSFPDKSRKNLIKYYSDRKNRFNDNFIKLYRQLSPQDVASFYKFEVSIEIDGVLIEAGQYMESSHFLDDLIVLFKNKNNVYLGRKEIPAPMEPNLKAHLVPKEKIDKVIGRKRYKKPEWIGTMNENVFTGEEEEIILDLRNFNEKKFKIFKEHNILTLA